MRRWHWFWRRPSALPPPSWLRRAAPSSRVRSNKPSRRIHSNKLSHSNKPNHRNKRSRQTKHSPARLLLTTGKYALLTGKSSDGKPTGHFLDDQENAQKYDGKQVTVTGTFDEASNTIHVTNIQAA